MEKLRFRHLLTIKFALLSKTKEKKNQPLWLANPKTVNHISYRHLFSNTVVQKWVHHTVYWCSHMILPRLAAYSDSLTEMENCSLVPSLCFRWTWHTVKWEYFSQFPPHPSPPNIYMKEIDYWDMQKYFWKYLQFSAHSLTAKSHFTWMWASAWEGRQNAAETEALCTVWARAWHQL